MDAQKNRLIEMVLFSIPTRNIWLRNIWKIIFNSALLSRDPVMVKNEQPDPNLSVHNLSVCCIKAQHSTVNSANGKIHYKWTYCMSSFYALTLCMLVNFSVFVICRFLNTIIRVAKSFYQDHAWLFVRPDLDLKCLQS